MSQLDMPPLVGRFLAENSGLNESEQWVIKWQYNLLGGFQRLLARAIAAADDTNLERLRSAFPVEVNGFLLWRDYGLAARLRQAGLEI